jgi:hypothetical protein
MKQFLIIAILGCLGWNAQAEGTLRLLNTKFDHPQLRDWAAAHPSLVTAQLQRGLDVLGLQDAAGEGKLSQSADSLGLAHGFLTFDYRISGLLASFTEETAGKLLPEIQQKMGAEYGVGAGQPYALLITWVSFQGKQLELLFHVNYEGFSRKSSYTTEQLALYKDLSASVFQTGDDEVNAILKIGSLVGAAWSRSASTVMKLYLLLLSEELPDAFFRVNGQTYTAEETLFVCTCRNDTVQILAYQSPGVPFPENTSWSGFENVHPVAGAISAIELTKETSRRGIIIQASFRDNNGQKQSIRLRVIALSVDYNEVMENQYFFDPNKIKEYGRQFRYNQKSRSIEERWLFIPSDGAERNDNNSTARVITSPTLDPPISLASTNGIRTGDANAQSVFTVDNGTAGEHQVFLNKPRCNSDSLELRVYSAPWLYLNAISVIVREQDDDIQVTPFGAQGTVCVTAGPNNFMDTKEQGNDVYDKVLNQINSGTDGICQTTADATSPVNPISIQSVTGLQTAITNFYRRVGVEIQFEAIKQKTMTYDISRNDTLDFTDNIYSRHDSSLESRYLDNNCNDCNAGIRLYFVANLGLLRTEQRTLAPYVGAAPIAQPDKLFMSTNIPKEENPYGTEFTCIHELGHALFRLQHPWLDNLGYYNTSANFRIIINRGETKETILLKGQDPENIMDYQNGNKLRKYQWVQIHNRQN